MHDSTPKQRDLAEALLWLNNLITPQRPFEDQARNALALASNMPEDLADATFELADCTAIWLNEPVRFDRHRTANPMPSDPETLDL